MHYFVTGATGFIGRRLVAQAARAQGGDRVLPGARQVGEAHRRAARVLGRRQDPRGAGPRRSRPARPRDHQGRAQASSRARITHFFHLAAVYDLKADEESQRIANIEGTRNVVLLRQRDRRRLLPPRELDRRRRPVRRRVPRGHVRGGGGPRPPVLLDQARVREARAPGLPDARGASTAPASSSATRAPARWTRSTGPTTSSS